ncbi:hypothetical protein BUALT_Bualt03G0095100 [Buddleja alternifolia]|uniref:Subtilisin-like protease n=1 Tax=Buddleja alternifolia TaxID=168488 RepID=A0AAV6XZ47_9LAMI|nr:hypothetical protein BUALT_Bualt03G0095100 [Buddleja alternifolia]
MLSAKFSNFLALFILFAVFQEPALAIKKSYIVYLGGHNHGSDVTSADLRRVTDSHTELLASFLGSKEKAKDAIFYSYKRHINGFAALLEEEEAAEIAKHPNVFSVFQNQGKKLHTTHSWDFLMLERDGVVHPSSIWKKARFGEDTIIGNLDSGVWPELESFSDKGMGPIPSKWKGICQFDDEKKGLCNRKLIGARYYNKAYAAYVGKLNSSYYTPRDIEGHGSHTLSTAGGIFVPGANVFGLGNGTAKGGSPKARVATYRVCYPPFNEAQCFDADILKGFDTAISDGVDVLSLSVGGDPQDYFKDGIAIGAFHAVKNGVVVITSAGNSGPSPGTVSNVAPWMITVAASTIDREFQANVILGTGQSFEGNSISKPLPSKGFYPLISAAHAIAANASAKDAILCMPDSLDSKKVKGKIVVCLRGINPRVEKGDVAARAGAVGMILCNGESDGNELLADPHVLPATHINYKDGLILFKYVNTSSNPQGYFTPPTTKLGTKPAPSMAAFSSRGPNLVTPQILKPDITAPGVNIVAGYSEGVGATELEDDKRRTPWIIMSGTSMSCPHVAGIVGLLKTLHPDWSPAAIRSAIMTSARTRDNTVNPMSDEDHSEATPFAYGAGHIRPNRAMDPGLVYDVGTNDYLDFLCGLGYNQTLLSQFTDSPYNCPEKYDIFSFNYPSFSVPNVNISGPVTFTRKVKNVGPPGTYVARIRQPSGFSISVEPNFLNFEKAGEEKSFKLTVKAKKAVKDFGFGQLIWSDGKHYVRSPIVVATAEIPN